MRAKRRTLLVLLGLIVLAAAALALLTWANRREEQAASAAGEGTIPLSSFAVEDLTALEYTWQGETVSLSYDGRTGPFPMTRTTTWTRPNATPWPPRWPI